MYDVPREPDHGNESAQQGLPATGESLRESPVTAEAVTAAHRVEGVRQHVAGEEKKFFSRTFVHGVGLAVKGAAELVLQKGIENVGEMESIDEQGILRAVNTHLPEAEKFSGFSALRGALLYAAWLVYVPIAIRQAAQACNLSDAIDEEEILKTLQVLLSDWIRGKDEQKMRDRFAEYREAVRPSSPDQPIHAA